MSEEASVCRDTSLRRAKPPPPGLNCIHRRFSSPSRKQPHLDALLPAASLRLSRSQTTTSIRSEKEKHRMSTPSQEMACEPHIPILRANPRQMGGETTNEKRAACRKPDERSMMMSTTQQPCFVVLAHD